MVIKHIQNIVLLKSKNICEENIMIQNRENSNDSLNEDEDNILIMIEKWMDHNIKTMIKGKCNVGCATLLGIYMEILGGISDGTLSEIDENGKFCKEKHNFERMLDLMPREYRSFNFELSRENNGRGLYEIYRCTLVHAYFFGSLDIKNNPDMPLSRCCNNKIGIQKSTVNENRIEIHTNDLADDINKVREDLFRKIREGQDSARINFRKTLGNIRRIQNQFSPNLSFTNIPTLSDSNGTTTSSFTSSE